VNLLVALRFGGKALLEGDRAATAIWKLEIFWWQVLLQRDRATLHSRSFRWWAQLENDRATTAIWELEILGGRSLNQKTPLFPEESPPVLA